MNKKRLLIFGGSSILALNWAYSMRNTLDITLVFHRRHFQFLDFHSLSIHDLNLRTITNCLKAIKPDFVLNAIGMTNVDDCELNPDAAFQINSFIPHDIALACSHFNSKLIHISTDHLFSGEHTLHDEESCTQPLNICSKSKLKAETLIHGVNSDSLILRTNFICWGTSYRASFTDRIISSIRSNRNITLFKDVMFSPVNAFTLAQKGHELATLDLSGIFNVCCDDKVSKLDAGLSICQEFNLDSSFIVPKHASDTSPLAQRPLDMSLSNQKLVRSTLHPVGSFAQQVRMLKLQESSVGSELKNL